jgi:DNA-binding GntR family transcriptional regulator
MTTHSEAGAPVEAVRRTSVAEDLRAALAERILGLQLPPGAALTEQSLAQRYDVSRNTVREALWLLAADGLVRHHRHRGAVVAEPTAENFTDLYAARTVVETAAARALAAADDAVLAPLRRAVERMAAVAEAGDGRGAVEADLAFHGSMVAAVGSE